MSDSEGRGLPWQTWMQRWSATLNTCREVGAWEGVLSVDPPASLAEVQSIENKLGWQIDASFREVLLNFSSKVHFQWFLGNEFRRDVEGGIHQGYCAWDAAALVSLEEGRKQWVEVCFSDRDDPFHRIWQTKYVFMSIGNGDYLAIDRDEDARGAVCYLAHDVDDLSVHGACLGYNFIDFLDRWTQLGCVGPDGFLLEPFLQRNDQGLAVDGDEARKWRSVFFRNGKDDGDGSRQAEVKPGQDLLE